MCWKSHCAFNAFWMQMIISSKWLHAPNMRSVTQRIGIWHTAGELICSREIKFCPQIPSNKLCRPCLYDLKVI